LGGLSWTVAVIPASKNARNLVRPSPIEGLVDELGYQGRGFSNAVFGNPSDGPDRLAVFGDRSVLDQTDAIGRFV
jgi:hypothetical protein